MKSAPRQVVETVFLAALMAATLLVTAGDPCYELWESVAPCQCSNSRLECNKVSSGDELLLIPGLQSGQSLGFNTIQIWFSPYLEDIPTSAFGNHYATYSYDFQYNDRLKTISGGLFSQASQQAMSQNYSQLTVTRNRVLQSFPFHALQGYENLFRVDLSENAISELPAQAFDGVSSNLSYISLSENALTSVGADAFANLPGLEVVKLSGNLLTTLTSESLWFSSRPDQLWIDSNNLSKFEPGFTNLLPSYVYAAGNKIETLEQATWEPLLVDYAASSVEGFLNFRANPFICDCRMKWLYDREDFELFFTMQADTTIHCSNLDGEPTLWTLDAANFVNC